MDQDSLRSFIDSISVQQEVVISHILGGNSQQRLFYDLRHGDWQTSKKHTDSSR
jgi:hypothetical protein